MTVKCVHGVLQGVGDQLSYHSCMDALSQTQETGEGENILQLEAASHQSSVSSADSHEEEHLSSTVQVSFAEPTTEPVIPTESGAAGGVKSHSEDSPSRSLPESESCAGDSDSNSSARLKNEETKNRMETDEKAEVANSEPCIPVLPSTHPASVPKLNLAKTQGPRRALQKSEAPKVETDPVMRPLEEGTKSFRTHRASPKLELQRQNTVDVISQTRRQLRPATAPGGMETGA